jgi:hypothetical protein
MDTREPAWVSISIGEQGATTEAARLDVIART